MVNHPTRNSRVRRNEPLHLLIDSTGVKIYGEGEWLDQKHRVPSRRRWRKLYLADFDEMARSIERMRVTPNQDAFLQENRVFHETIARASRNPVLESFWAAISLLASGEQHGISYSFGIVYMWRRRMRQFCKPAAPATRPWPPLGWRPISANSNISFGAAFVPCWKNRPVC
jgi:hypothetical protein